MAHYGRELLKLDKLPREGQNVSGRQTSLILSAAETPNGPGRPFAVFISNPYSTIVFQLLAALLVTVFAYSVPNLSLLNIVPTPAPTPLAPAPIVRAPLIIAPAPDVTQATTPPTTTPTPTTTTSTTTTTTLITTTTSTPTTTSPTTTTASTSTTVAMVAFPGFENCGMLNCLFVDISNVIENISDIVTCCALCGDDSLCGLGIGSCYCFASCGRRIEVQFMVGASDLDCPVIE